TVRWEDITSTDSKSGGSSTSASLSTKKNRADGYCLRVDYSAPRSCPNCTLLRTIMIWEVFFFSSRRRHTRFSRDWSSDVCSSDLHFLPIKIRRHPPIVKGENFLSLVVAGRASDLNQGSIQCSGGDEIGGEASTGTEGPPFEVVRDGVPLIGNGQHPTF